MILPIEPHVGRREWCIVELQGELQHSAGLKAGYTVGDLSLHPTKSDVLYLQIGYHRLEGKKVLLARPIAILRRDMKGTHGDDSVADHSGCEEGSEAEDASPVGFSIVGFITCKYLFKSRPKALISNPHK